MKRKQFLYLLAAILCMPLCTVTAKTVEATSPDGINSSQQAKDYRIIKKTINKDEKLSVDMSRGGGFIGIINIIK